MPTSKLHTHDEVLEALSEAIEIPRHLDELARSRYQSIGNWLNRDESSIAHLDPDISPQGSFLLGTAIRPIHDDDAYDVDIVCTLKATTNQVTMKQLKEMVGKEILLYAKAQNMNKIPEDSRRCWKLDYSDNANFHLDVLPSIPDVARYKDMLEAYNRRDLLDNDEITQLAIAITDNKLPNYTEINDDWPVSNPKGYGLWFNSRQASVLDEAKRKLVDSNVYASVDDVPTYRVKTPLQRAIQLLKRHRDILFHGDEDKPISIIITTLASHAYNGEISLKDAIYTILKNMQSYISNENGITQITNPVNPKENFADKWPETPKKKENFDYWLEQAQKDFGLYFNQAFSDIPKPLQDRIGSSAMNAVIPNIEDTNTGHIKSVVAAEVASVQQSGEATKPWRK